MKKLTLIGAICLSFSLISIFSWGQKKYQSLLWEVSGNGLAKPSYLYGTMHVSEKLVFQLGDPFYNAMESVDVVALELEPELWLKDMFEEDGFSRGNGWGDNEYDYYQSNTIFQNQFVYSDMIQENVKNVLSYDPPLLNYMLFRFDQYGESADFEENTWLDMYIYQTGKRMGKKTIGLETYTQSTWYGMLAEKEERNSKMVKKFDEKDRKKLRELQQQIEPAYRRQDLDLVDSISNSTNGKSFNKYILFERNKVFINTIDSVLKSGQTIFAGMGCAHLPGNEGVIESLRRMGYNVNPVDKGTRDAKRREKLDKIVYKRDYSTFETEDKIISFQAPCEVFPLGSNGEYIAWLAMDIPNGATFSTYRFKTYGGAHGYSPDYIVASIDSILYEAIPGDIISNKKMLFSGFQTMDIINKTRRGEGQRRRIIVTPEEIIVLKLTASGEKVLKGFGDEFFNSFKLNYSLKNSNGEFTSPDKAVHFKAPGDLTYYPSTDKFRQSNYEEVTCFDKATSDYFTMYRIVEPNQFFIDEKDFINNDMAYFFQENNEYEKIEEHKSSVSNFPSWHGTFKDKKGNMYHAEFLQVNLDNYAFIVKTTDEKRATRFFESIELKKPSYSDIFQYTDSSQMFFTMNVPFDLEALRNPLTYNFDWSDPSEVNESEGLRRTMYIEPLTTHESVQVKMKRYHQFYYEKDTASFLKKLTRDIRNEEWMYKKENFQKTTPNGLKVSYTYTDTSSTRAIDVLFELYNSTLYQITASYDTVLGKSSFITETFNSFSPFDTTFNRSIFVDNGLEFIDALYSTDSTTQKNAFLLAEEVSLSNKCSERIRYVLKHLPEFEEKSDVEAIKNNLLSELWRDTSLVNIDFLSQEYYLNADSANIQTRILQNLGWMDTKEATLRFKKLLLDEPPIGGRISSFSPLRTMRDSLELAKLLFPDAFSLVSLNEYEGPTYDLLALLIDSAVVSPKIYEPNLNLILLEAKNELKRVNGSDETSYNFNTSDLLNYCSLLLPHKTKPEVKSFFDKIYRSKKNTLLLDIIQFNHEHKIATPDSIIQKLSATPDLQYKLYRKLTATNQLDLLTANWNNSDSLVYFYCKNQYESKYNKENKLESASIISIKSDTIKGKPYKVIYVKFKRKNEFDYRGTVLVFEDKGKAFSDEIWKPEETVVLDQTEDETIELDRVYRQIIRQHREPDNGNNYSGWETLNYGWD